MRCIISTLTCTERSQYEFSEKKKKSLFNAVEAAEAAETVFVLEGSFPWLKVHMEVYGSLVQKA